MEVKNKQTESVNTSGGMSAEFCKSCCGRKGYLDRCKNCKTPLCEHGKCVYLIELKKGEKND